MTNLTSLSFSLTKTSIFYRYFAALCRGNACKTAIGSYLPGKFLRPII
jgi:hypothetical protein